MWKCCTVLRQNKFIYWVQHIHVSLTSIHYMFKFTFLIPVCWCGAGSLSYASVFLLGSKRRSVKQGIQFWLEFRANFKDPTSRNSLFRNFTVILLTNQRLRQSQNEKQIKIKYVVIFPSQSMFKSSRAYSFIFLKVRAFLVAIGNTARGERNCSSHWHRLGVACPHTGAASLREGLQQCCLWSSESPTYAG